MKTVNKTILLNGVKTKIQYQIEVKSDVAFRAEQELLFPNVDDRTYRYNLTIAITGGETFIGCIDSRFNKAKKTSGMTSIYIVGDVRAKNEKTLLELLLNKK